MQVRPLESRDRADWLDLFNAYIEFYQAVVAPEVIELTFSRLLGGEMLGLVAVDDDDRPVGLAHSLFHRSTWSATGYCYLEDLYVAPHVRGRGLGRALIEAVYRAADERTCTRTYWVTREDNAAARALYDSLAAKSPFVQYRRN